METNAKRPSDSLDSALLGALAMLCQEAKDLGAH